MFLAVMAAVGYTRGFARTLFGMAMLVFSLVATIVLSASVAEVFAESSNVNAMIQGLAEGYLDELSAALAEGEVSVPLQELLPDQEGLGEAMVSGGAEYVAELLGMEEFRGPLIRRIVSLAVNGLGILITFILVRLVFFFIGLLGRGIFGSRKPGGFDRFLGMCFAVFRGILEIWLVMTIARVFSFTTPCGNLMRMMEESEVLTWLDDHNLVLAVLLNVLRS